MLILIKLLMLLMLLLGLVPLISEGANRHVRQGASGANNGTDWTNAYTTLPTTLTRGDTYYIADGSYGSHTIDDAVSGTTLITIKKATEAEHGSATGWDTAYGDGVALWTSLTMDASYVIFDGAVGGGPTDWFSGHGFRVVMANAASAKGFRFNGGKTNITIRHTEVDGTAGGAQQSHDGIYDCCAGTQNVTLQYVWVHDTGRTTLLSIAGDGWLVEYSAFQRPGSNAGQHSEIWSTHEGGGTDTPDDWIVRYSVFTDPISTGGVMTSGLRWQVYGNLFANTASNTCPCSNGIFGGWSAQPGGQHKVYNNTFLDFQNNQGKLFPVAGGSGSIVKNNLFFNVANYTNGAGTKSHNAFGASGTPGESNQQILSSTGEAVFAIYGSTFWQPATDDLQLEIATTAGDFGIGAAYNTDAFGVLRGEDGIWDRGAYELAEGGVEPPLNAPTGLRITGMSRLSGRTRIGP